MDGEQRAAFIESLRREESTPFTGWDFSHIAGRMSAPPLPWSFETLARDALRAARRVVDLGTGGGERLAALLGDARDGVVATEGFAANVPVAWARLAPLGVPVIASTAKDLPFRNDRFDLVMSRRAGFAASEVARVLVPGGRLLTEQIATGIGPALRQALGHPASPEPDHAARFISRCTDAGLTIEHFEDDDGCVSLSDVGAVVYLLRAVPWTVPGFSVEAYVEPLFELHVRIERSGPLTLPRRMCLLVARRAV